MPRNRTRMVALSALLVAVMLILGYIENLIPLGMPGIKLGLSNSVLLLAIYWLGVPRAFILMGLKVFLSGFMFAGVNAMMYSLAGGLLSMIAMALLHLVPDISPMGVGAVGAVMHNVGQVGLAMIVIGNDGLVYYMGILVLVGLVTGIVTGYVSKLLMQRLPAELRPDPKKE